jgi:hypothetical protein
VDVPHSPRRRTVAFKADAETVACLAALPNASGFVRRAVLAALRRQCPLCGGAGRVPVGVGQHYGPFVRDHPPPAGTDSPTRPLPGG